MREQPVSNVVQAALGCVQATREARAQRQEQRHAFLRVPRVKFMLKFQSYLVFLTLYMFVLGQDAGLPRACMQ